MKLHCFVITLIGALSLVGAFADANRIAGGLKNKAGKRNTINAVLEDASSDEVT